MTFDEWFYKEYEPADLQIKQYAERKEDLHIPATVYLEDLKKAFEAGLHADVHTDNSKVIAELEEKLANADYQLEGRDVTIKELKAQLKSISLKIIYCIKSHLCKQDEDYDKPIISPKFLSDTLDQMAIDGFEEVKEK